MSRSVAFRHFGPVVGSRGNWTLVGNTFRPGDNGAECGTTTLYTGVAQHLSWIRQQTGITQ
ncbi:hypothetical protein [Actinosynnema sp. ALI-1.44]|uniref:hypothetical protein n=1 Tax=Actinosynnema sp. ALI-1.44 TaxID=1933779 RepID=UPI001EDC5DCD|nr:hypothetical protein [Actinosynnema sp. ALI-1.44]